MPPGTAQKAREYSLSTGSPALAASLAESHTPTPMAIAINRLYQDREKEPGLIKIGSISIVITYPHLMASASLFSMARLVMAPIFTAWIIPSLSIKRLVGMAVIL